MADSNVAVAAGSKVRKAAQNGRLTIRLRSEVDKALRAVGVDIVDINNVFKHGGYRELLAVDDGIETLEVGGRLDDSTPVEIEAEIFEGDDGDGDPKKLNARVIRVKWPQGKPARRKERARRLQLTIVEVRRRK